MSAPARPRIAQAARVEARRTLMPIPATQFIWFNGKLVPWEKATVHVLSHALHYGSSVFEGVRAYETPKGVAIFRLRDHTRRLFDSAKIYRIAHAVHARADQRGLPPGRSQSTTWRGALPAPDRVPRLRRDRRGAQDRSAGRSRDRRLGMGQVSRRTRAKQKGVDVCVSSWQRVAPNTIPALAKAGGNYLSSQLIGAEAQPARVRRRHRPFAGRHGERRRGREPVPRQGRRAAHAGPRALGARRHHARLPSCAWRATAASRCARWRIPRELLYLADELFFTGTAAEITPIRSVDRLRVGNGKRGPDHRSAAGGLLRAVRRARPRTSGAGSTTSTCQEPRAVATVRR